MKAIHGECTDVRQIKSQQIARVYIEIPIEHTKNAIAFALNESVLVTLTDKTLPFGVLDADNLAVDTGPPDASREPSVGGAFMKAVHSRGFFRAPKVLQAIGTDVEFREWIRLQKSAISGEFNEIATDGEGRCVAAHFNRIAGEHSESKTKTDYSCIPLTQSEHLLQHSEGYEALRPMEWWNRTAASYASKWAHEQLRVVLCTEHLSELDPKVIRDWADDHDLGVYLPK